MPRFVYEGRTKVRFVSTISNIAAPTVAEINAGTDLTGFTAKDGVDTPANQNNVDSATIADTFDAQVPGSWGGSVGLTLFRDDSADTAWNLLTYGLVGYLVISRVATNFPTVGNKVEVWPVTSHQPVVLPSAGNETVKFTAQFPVRSQPNLSATVA